MTPVGRLLDYLDDMRKAAEQAVELCRDITPEDFDGDVRTQLAVAMTFVLIAEAASRIAADFPHFLADHPEIAWTKIRGMRNLVVQDYNKLDLPVVWAILQSELPKLISQIDQSRNPHPQGE